MSVKPFTVKRTVLAMGVAAVVGLYVLAMGVISQNTGPLHRNHIRERRLTSARQGRVVGMMNTAWQGYRNYSWGYNELDPIGRKPHKNGLFGTENSGATIVDALDTLLIMGLHSEVAAGREWIEKHLDFDTG